MTAEIAILNKSAVALAADSAVTIGRPPNAKVYNTVNKIFQLSDTAPVGIMVYGRLDFMELPFEIIIKEYRRHLGSVTFPHVEGYRDSFREYLLKHCPHNATDDIKNIYYILSAHLSAASDEFDDLVLSDMVKRGSFLRSRLNGILQRHLRAKIVDERSASFAPNFNRIALPAAYIAGVDAIAKQSFRGIKLTQGSIWLIRKWAGYFLSKVTLSESRSGIVIAGFGEHEWCPSLTWFETDGIVDSKLKYEDKGTVDIGRRTNAGERDAEILGFAQEDMIKSFLEGVDPTIKDYLLEMIEQAISDTADSTVKGLAANPVTAAANLAAMAATINDMKKDAKEKAERYIETNGRKPIRDMIQAMPKQELARLAESLIEITSLKRKVTRGQETVGGEVDVAIISKSEGFVWTKRKHYFPAELNPRFMARHLNG